MIYSLMLDYTQADIKLRFWKFFPKVIYGNLNNKGINNYSLGHVQHVYGIK